MTLCNACYLIDDNKLGCDISPCEGCILGFYFDDPVILDKLNTFYIIKMSLTRQELREKFHMLESQAGVEFVRCFIPELIREIEHLDQKLSFPYEKVIEVESMLGSRYDELPNVQREYNHLADQYNKLVESLGKDFTEMSMGDMFAQLADEQLPDEENWSTVISPYSKSLFYEDLGKDISLFYESIVLSPEKPSGETSLLVPLQSGRHGPRLPRTQQLIQWGRHCRRRLPRTRRLVFEFALGQDVQQVDNAAVVEPYADLEYESTSEESSENDDPDYDGPRLPCTQQLIQWGRRCRRLPRTRRLVFEYALGQDVQQVDNAAVAEPYVDLEYESTSEESSENDDPDYDPNDSN